MEKKSYKEMYIYLYKNMEFLQRVSKRIDSAIDDVLIEATSMHIAQIKAEMEGPSELERRIKRLFKEE